MEYKQLKEAIQKGTPLKWEDPSPIEGNDYEIHEVLNLPDEDPEEGWEDFILVIHYGGGSEAEVLPNEIAFSS